MEITCISVFTDLGSKLWLVEKMSRDQEEGQEGVSQQEEEPGRRLSWGCHVWEPTGRAPAGMEPIHQQGTRGRKLAKLGTCRGVVSPASKLRP